MKRRKNVSTHHFWLSKQFHLYFRHTNKHTLWIFAKQKYVRCECCSWTYFMWRMCINFIFFSFGKQCLYGNEYVFRIDYKLSTTSITTTIHSNNMAMRTKKLSQCVCWFFFLHLGFCAPNTESGKHFRHVTFHVVCSCYFYPVVKPNDCHTER